MFASSGVVLWTVTCQVEKFLACKFIKIHLKICCPLIYSTKIIVLTQKGTVKKTQGPPAKKLNLSQFMQQLMQCNATMH